MQSELTKEREVDHEQKAGAEASDTEKSDRVSPGKHGKSGLGEEQSGHPHVCERS